jgi:hypothetical protein
MKLDEQHDRKDNEQSSAVREVDATLEAASSPAGVDCPMALGGSEEAEPSLPPPPLVSAATHTGS